MENEGNVIEIHLEHLTDEQAREVAEEVAEFLNTRFPHYAFDKLVS